MMKSKLLLTAVVGAALFLFTPGVGAVQITIDLALCTMPGPDSTVCSEGVAFTQPDPLGANDPLWIDFTLNGTPGAHVVAQDGNPWAFEFKYDGVINDSDSSPPTLALTDMGGIIPGFEAIEPLDGECFSPDCTYEAGIPALTYIHDLHLEAPIPFPGTSVSLQELFIFSNSIPHEKGLWAVPEPATLALLVTGLIGLRARRRLR